MKKIIALIVVVVLAFAMVGCGDKEEKKETEATLGEQSLLDVNYKLEDKAWKDNTNYKEYKFNDGEKLFDLDISRTTLSDYYDKDDYVKNTFDYIKKSESYKNLKKKDIKIGDDEAIEYSYNFSEYTYYNGFIIFHNNVAYKFHFSGDAAKTTKDQTAKIKETISFEK